jgi:hypothetical protein
MTFLSGVFKFIAVVLMVILVIFLPITLLIQGVGSLLLSPGKMVELLEENIIDAEVIASVAQNEVNRRDFNQEQDNPAADIVVEGLRNLDHDKWVELIRLVAPPKLINETIEEGLVGYYRWVDSPDAVPEVQIDLEDWKSTLITNFVPALELIMYALPECTDAQQNQFFTNGNLAENLPSCRPTDPVYGIFIEQAGTTFPALIEDLPDEYTLGSELEEENIEWSAAKKNLQTFAFVTQASWILMLIIFVVAIPMGARSLSGVFKWAGWPIILAGILTLILAVLLLIFARGGMPNANPVLSIARSSPAVLSRPVGKLLGEGLRFIARPLLFEAGAMILLGGIAVIVGIVLSSKASPQEQITPEATPPPPLEPSADPAETIEFTEEQLDQPPEDDERPSGMFG